MATAREKAASLEEEGGRREGGKEIEKKDFFPISLGYITHSDLIFCTYIET